MAERIMPYHKKKIKKGTLGDISKIREELEELEDAQEQDCKIMMAVELSDLYGAIKHFAKTLGLDMYDLQVMSSITESAFKDGTRK